MELNPDPMELYSFVYNSNFSNNSKSFYLSDSYFKIYNVSYRSWTLLRTVAPGFGSYLYQYWYFDSKVNSSVMNLENANITIKDNNNVVYSALTDSNGLITQQNLLDYVAWNNATSSIDGIYYSLFNVTISKSGYISNSTTLNITQLTNYNHLVTLQTQLTSVINYPINLSYLNYNQSVNLNFTVTNGTSLSKCLFTTNNYITNTTIANCLNTTFNISDGNYLLKLWVNDSTNNKIESSVNFTIDITTPLIFYGTNSETEGNNLSRNNIYVNTHGLKLTLQISLSL